MSAASFEFSFGTMIVEKPRSFAERVAAKAPLIGLSVPSSASSPRIRFPPDRTRVLRRQKIRQRHRQIEDRSFFLYVRRRERDDHFMIFRFWRVEAGMFDGGTDPVARLLDGLCRAIPRRQTNTDLARGLLPPRRCPRRGNSADAVHPRKGHTYAALGVAFCSSVRYAWIIASAEIGTVMKSPTTSAINPVILRTIIVAKSRGDSSDCPW